ncbi:Hypothetical predicted protein [Marmota monax]|uniref:Uncharacterized protein n=1 Tax=Marmota monax TaxID=9995 RepID=A0A5E4BS53_MARMO|nr:hypothetical protein GHT09_019135 [Marmota monax]VTJ72454.1 Hypothetical predicted protein [Marmota monax]
MARLLGTSSGLAIGEDRMTRWSREFKTRIFLLKTFEVRSFHPPLCKPLGVLKNPH